MVAQRVDPLRDHPRFQAMQKALDRQTAG